MTQAAELPSASRDHEPAAFTAELASRSELTRRAELERTLRRLAHLSEDDKQHIEELSRQIVNAIILEPLSRLEETRHHLPAARDLFQPGPR